MLLKVFIEVFFTINISEHADFFKINQDGAAINLDLTVPSLPSELFREQNLLLYLRATKPRTVGATTAISIALPAGDSFKNIYLLVLMIIKYKHREQTVPKNENHNV